MRENDLNPHDIVQAHYRSLKLKNAADAGSQCRIWSKNRLETPKVRSHRIAPHQLTPPVQENGQNPHGSEEKGAFVCKNAQNSHRHGHKGTLVRENVENLTGDEKKTNPCRKTVKTRTGKGE